MLERIKAEMALSPEERQKLLIQREKEKCEAYNRTPGNLKDGYTTNNVNGNGVKIEGDGYDCKLCLNRGDSLHFRVDEAGHIREYMEFCKCMEVRKSIWRLRQSGLEKSIRDNTFKRFTVTEPWQQAMLDMAQRYLAEGVKEGRWLYMGGQPGCGKTHICTAVAGKLLYERPLLYVVWPQISKKLKAIVNEAEDYEREVGRLEYVNVLYIDDLFKPVYGEDRAGNRVILPPSAADIKLAFEILNFRYINKLPTIISSEWHIADLSDMDEATGSRIAERSTGYCLDIARNRERNHRLLGITTV